MGFENDVVEFLVLGPQGAGKTTWYNFLRHIQGDVPRATLNKEEYDSFMLELSDRKIKVKKGFDYGGTKENHLQYTDVYQKILTSEKKKAVFFCFSALNFLKNAEYQRDVISRLGFIERYGSQCKNIYLMISHQDKLKNPEKAFVEIKNILYRGEIQREWICSAVLLNMQDKKMLEAFQKGLKIE